MNPKKIEEILNHYIPHPQMPLLWSDPFTLLVAVLLSARCPDQRVNQITPKLFALAKTPQAMATLDPREIEAIIRPCGLAPTKSRAIVALSCQLLKRHKGHVPATLKQLEALPGVGHKTASVVVIHAFHQAAFPVDTHIQRCARRWGLSKGTTVEKIEKDLKRAFPKSHWAKVHLQMILFARTYCLARAHNKKQCPMCSILFND